MAESPAKCFIKIWRPGVYDFFGSQDVLIESVVMNTTKDWEPNHNPPWWDRRQGYLFDPLYDDFYDSDLDQSPGRCTSSVFDNLPNYAGVLGWHTHGNVSPSGVPYMVGIRFARGNWLGSYWEGQNTCIWWIGGRSGMNISAMNVTMADGTTQQAYGVRVLPAYFNNNWRSALDANKSILLGVSCYSAYPTLGSTLIDDVGGRVRFGYEESVTSMAARMQLSTLLCRMNGISDPYSSARREANDAFNYGNFPWYFPPNNKIVMRPILAPLTTLCPFVGPVDIIDHHWTDSTRTKWRVTHVWNLNTKSTKTGDVFTAYLPGVYKTTRISETMVSDHELRVVWEMDGNTTYGPWAKYDLANLKASSGGSQQADLGSAPNGDYNYSPIIYMPPGNPPP